MKRITLIPAVFCGLLLTFAPALADVGTAFTYQGLLTENGNPVTGIYEFRFNLYATDSDLTTVTTGRTNYLVPVTNGLFMTKIDFGDVFHGEVRWLDIGSRTNGSTLDFTPLSPREELTPTPYAMFAANANTLGGQPATAFAPNSGSSAYVAKAGDTMTGDLVVQGQVSGDGSYYSTGIFGTSHSLGQLLGTGVWGENTAGGIGVKGTSDFGWAVFGQSQSSIGVFGQTLGNNNAGVLGRSEGTGGQGVFGYSPSTSAGVLGVSVGGDGVSGRSDADGKSGVVGFSTSAAGYAGSFYNSAPGGVSLKVFGNATVDVLTINGADVAEPFQVTTKDVSKGSVMVIDEENPGQLKLSDRPYDKRVAGILSGANGVRAGICLSQQGFNDGGQNLALSGRVFVLADASNSPIKPGDLLTTSGTPGHAMKATDYSKIQGAILGKAMSALREGQGMVLVLVSLQ